MKLQNARTASKHIRFESFLFCYDQQHKYYNLVVLLHDLSQLHIFIILTPPLDKICKAHMQQGTKLIIHEHGAIGFPGLNRDLISAAL
jgi:hypothetical protein